MSRQVFVLEEVVAMLQATGAAAGTIEKFRKQAEFVAGSKRQQGYDDVQVASGYGATSKRGHVELTVNDQRIQMDPKKAREIGLMLIESAEAATSDEMFMTLLARIGIDDAEKLGRILIDLREIRQGARGVVYPT